MRTRPAEITLGVAITLVIAVVGILAVSCKTCRHSVDGSRLDLRLTGADSPEDIERKIRAILAEKYSPEDVAGSYTMYHVTNGLARWVFVKTYNAPRGLNAFNLYCYEWESSDIWLLRGYVPINAYFYTNSLGRELSIQIDNDYVNVVFRGSVVFTIKSKTL